MGCFPDTVSLNITVFWNEMPLSTWRKDGTPAVEGKETGISLRKQSTLQLECFVILVLSKVSMYGVSVPY